MGEKQSLPLPKDPEPKRPRGRMIGLESPEELSQIEAQEMEERLRYLGYIE
jgi:hypothetical protein